MIIQHILLAFLWIFYCIVHSLLATASAKLFFAKKMGKYFRYYRLAYSIFATVTLLLLLYYQFSLISPLLFHSLSAMFLSCFILVIPGLVIMLVTIYKYFKLLSGVRSLYQEKQFAELKVDGIHKYMRHPLYTGTLLFIWGLFFIFPFLNNIIAVVSITAYILIGISYEEQKLIIEFGDSYKDYCLKVPRLIPHFQNSL